MTSELLAYFSSNEKSLLKRGLKPFPEDRFIIQSHIDEGGFGKVEKCYDVIKKIFVAHKYADIFVINMNGDRRFNKIYGFLREINILKLLKNNQYFCRTLGSYYQQAFGRDSIGSLHIITELGDCNLKQLIDFRRSKNKGPAYTADETFQIAARLLKSLDELQKLKIFHADLKPQNIIYSSRDKQFKIIDFSISRLIKTGINTNKVELGDNVIDDKFYKRESGNIEYVPPELKIKYAVSEIYAGFFDPFKADIWSISKILFECLEDEASCKKPEEILDKELMNMMIMMNCQEWYKRKYARDILTEFSHRLISLPVHEDEEFLGKQPNRNRDLMSVKSFYERNQLELITNLCEKFPFPQYLEKKNKRNNYF